VCEQFWGRAVRERPKTLTGVWGVFVFGRFFTAPVVPILATLTLLQRAWTRS
jgi:hypothetical protein